jgi:O-antigen/teichoic acid export membrane protein
MKEIEMRSKFKLSALTVIGVRVGSAVGTFAFASVLSHWMAKDDYGAVALLMTVVVFTGIIFNFGQRDLLIREVSKYLTNDDTASAYMFSKRSVLWSLIGGCLGGILVAIGFYVRGESLIFSLSAGLIVPLLSVNHTWAGCATSRKSFFWAIAPRDLLWRIIVLMIVGGYFWVHNGVSVERDVAAPIILIVFLTLVFVQKFALGSSVAPFSLTGVTPAPELRKPSFNFCLGSLILLNDSKYP